MARCWMLSFVSENLYQMGFLSISSSISTSTFFFWRLFHRQIPNHNWTTYELNIFSCSFAVFAFEVVFFCIVLGSVLFNFLAFFSLAVVLSVVGCHESKQCDFHFSTCTAPLNRTILPMTVPYIILNDFFPLNIAPTFFRLHLPLPPSLPYQAIICFINPFTCVSYFVRFFSLIIIDSVIYISPLSFFKHSTNSSVRWSVIIYFP